MHDETKMEMIYMRKDLFFLFLFDPFRAYTAVHSKLISVFKSLNT
jgi:hypothetical protein